MRSDSNSKKKKKIIEKMRKRNKVRIDTKLKKKQIECLDEYPTGKDEEGK